ncbi:neuropilin-2-like [Leptonychotes weddellii]|uniref:Neuropilin-2-like n=1 Tax=Leptonychotes weddellii TaxID=9713 RepID=A0A7F8Q8E4_LEPWE|nr:neuropilin-2-like [Leptonychotes weddellii]
MALDPHTSSLKGVEAGAGEGACGRARDNNCTRTLETKEEEDDDDDDDEDRVMMRNCHVEAKSASIDYLVEVGERAHSLGAGHQGDVIFADTCPFVPSSRRYDFIEIRDGDSESADLLGKHCGNIAPPTIISSGSVLYIKFTSDYARQGAGFSLRYEIFKTGSEDCSKNFTSPNGTIESPGFPEKYPHNLDCTFTILAKPKMEIILQFLTFDLEHDPLQVGEGDCKYDWLDIWDGIPHVGPLIGKYCGTKTPSELRSSTGILSLTFHTDMAVAKDGFSARYYLVHQEPPENFQCNVPLGMESGRIANEQISASSTYSDERWTPQQSRLHGDDNGWTPNLDSSKEYLQVDLRFLTMLTAIATQGAISRETQNGYYVKSYKLEVSTNGEDWMVYRHGKNHKLQISLGKGKAELALDALGKGLSPHAPDKLGAVAVS